MYSAISGSTHFPSYVYPQTRVNLTRVWCLDARHSFDASIASPRLRKIMVTKPSPGFQKIDKQNAFCSNDKSFWHKQVVYEWKLKLHFLHNLRFSIREVWEKNSKTMTFFFFLISCSVRLRWLQVWWWYQVLCTNFCPEWNFLCHIKIAGCANMDIPASSSDSVKYEID